MIKKNKSKTQEKTAQARFRSAKGNALLISMLILSTLMLAFAIIGSSSTVKDSQLVTAMENKALSRANSLACMELGLNRLGSSLDYAGNETISINGEECMIEPIVHTLGICTQNCGGTSIIAQAIVCDQESDLPNWGNGGADITAVTALNYVNSHPRCRFSKGWSFQWNGNHAANPGDNTDVSDDPDWHTFGPTDSSGMVSTTVTNIESIDLLQIRLGYKEGYIPFTYEVSGNNDNISAEVYCGSDVLNYDNLEWINNPKAVTPIYCVSFQVPQSIVDDRDSEVGDSWLVKSEATVDEQSTSYQTEVTNRNPIEIENFKETVSE